MTRCDPIIPCRKVQNPILRKYATYPFLQRHLTSPDDGIFILRTPPPIYMASPLARLSDDNAAGGFARDPAAVRELHQAERRGFWQGTKRAGCASNPSRHTPMAKPRPTCHLIHSMTFRQPFAPRVSCPNHRPSLVHPMSRPQRLSALRSPNIVPQRVTRCLSRPSRAQDLDLHPNELRVISTVPGRRHT